MHFKLNSTKVKGNESKSMVKFKTKTRKTNKLFTKSTLMKRLLLNLYPHTNKKLLITSLKS